ncbi:MAG: T9SS type A sorting domain-containing protein [Segetibacter sp.]
MSFKTLAATVTTTYSNAVTALKSLAAPFQVDLQVKAQPNPSTDAFTLYINGASEARLALQVTDMLGHIVEVKTGLAEKGSVRIGQAYRPGVYLVTVVQGSERKTIKLIKQ